jgi:tetratricopeptide (TPR) repeat protein
MLIQEIPAHADRTDRLALLQEARRLFEVGLNLNAFSGERGRLERDLGLCLVLTAQNVTNVLEKRSLYEEAMRRFGSAAQVDAVAPTPQLSGRWGIALVEYGKLTNDRMALRQAVERLTTALEQDSQNNEARYNLACAYALLEQPGNAMRHLRVCLENDDSKRTYYQTALQDPDLSSLRRTREYYDLVNEKQPPRPVLVQPVITDR